MKSKNLNANQNSGSYDPRYYFLAEFSISEFESCHDRGDEHTAELLFRAVRELVTSPDWVENIDLTLAGFAKAALEHYKDGRLEAPGRIRIFCQKKIIDDANSAKSSRSYQVVQVKEHARKFPDSGVNMLGGWGYFLIERGEDFLPYSSANPHNCIDLYLYREGG